MLACQARSEPRFERLEPPHLLRGERRFAKTMPTPNGVGIEAERLLTPTAQ